MKFKLVISVFILAVSVLSVSNFSSAKEEAKISKKAAKEACISEGIPEADKKALKECIKAKRK